MKKILSLFSAALLMLVFVGCGGESEEEIPEYMSETYYNSGVQLVQLCDDVIDLKTDFSTAVDQSANLLYVLENYSYSGDHPTGESTVLSIKVSCSAIDMDLLQGEAAQKTGGLNSGHFDELKKDRNRISEYFNIEKR